MFKCDPNSNTQCRWRLRDPQEFTKMWTDYEWKNLKTKGISFIVGIDAYGKKGVQAIRFDKDLWTENKAAHWWEKNKQLFKKTWTQKDWEKFTKRKGAIMLSPEVLNKYTLKSFLKWVKLTPEDLVGDDDDALEILKEYLDSPLYSISKFMIFEEIEEAVEDFINEMESKKASSITNIYMNPVTEKMEDYTLDYSDGKFIIIEPREEEQKEFQLILEKEEDFINYLIEKGENRFDAIDIANSLKEEAKIASLIKVANNGSITFDSNARVEIFLDENDIEYDDRILKIKEMDISLSEKIKLAYDIVKDIAYEKARTFENGDITIADNELTHDTIEWASILSFFKIGDKIELLTTAYKEDDTGVPIGTIAVIKSKINNYEFIANNQDYGDFVVVNRADEIQKIED